MDRQHPVVECAADVRTSLKDVASVEPAFMSLAEKQAALVALVEVRSQLDALVARVLAVSDDVGQAPPKDAFANVGLAEVPPVLPSTVHAPVAAFRPAIWVVPSPLKSPDTTLSQLAAGFQACMWEMA